jgi:hypothetical protein
MLLRNKNGFCKLAVIEMNEISARTIEGIESALNAGQLDVPLLRKFRTECLGQIRHQLEIVEPALIDRLVDLRPAERRTEPFGQFRPFEIEKEIHFVLKSACRGRVLLLLGLQLPHERVDFGNDARVSPMFEPGMPYNVAVSVDEKRLRKLVDFVQASDLMPWIKIRRQIEIVLFVELMDLRPIVIDADFEHLKLTILEHFMEPLNFGHFLHAACAPGAPEIQKDDFAAEIAELDEPATFILDRKVGCLLADVDHTGIAHIRGLLEDEESGNRTDYQEENNGFYTLAHNPLLYHLRSHFLLPGMHLLFKHFQGNGTLSEHGVMELPDIESGAEFLLRIRPQFPDFQLTHFVA